jgi:hypothetical protein
MFRFRVLACLIALATTASADPEFTASLISSEPIEPSPNLRNITMFDFWSRSAGATSDGRCFGITKAGSNRQLSEVDPERCRYVKPNEIGFPSRPCATEQEVRLSGWVTICRNLPDGRYELVAKAAKSTGVKARVHLLTGNGESLHFGVFGLHDRQIIRILSVDKNNAGRIDEYVWSADAAARYFSQRAQSTPRS